MIRNAFVNKNHPNSLPIAELYNRIFNMFVPTHSVNKQMKALRSIGVVSFQFFIY